jgi:RND family efflux transporter MFP subunit
VGGFVVHAQEADRPAPRIVHRESRNWLKPGEYAAITQPSERAELAFPVNGLVAEVIAREGTRVETGQPIMRLDDRIERQNLKVLTLEAESDLAVKAKQATLDTKRVILERVKWQREQNVASDLELEQAELEVVVGELELQQAHHEMEKKRLEKERQELQVEQMTITSKFAGIIESLVLDVGEVVDPYKPALTVVQNNPLHVELTLPSGTAQKLDMEKPVTVKYVGEEDKKLEAKVIFISPMVDAASDTQFVRMELPNPEERESGLQMIVEIP